MTAIGSSSLPGAKPAVTQAEQAKTAAKQLEAFFLRQLLAEAKPQGGGGLDAGFAGDTFKGMLDEAIADKMSAAGGIGISRVFEKQLQGVSATEATGPMAMPGALAMTQNQPRTEAPIGAIGHVPEPTIYGPELGNAPRFAMPVSGRGTSGYGERIDPIHGTRSMHPGVDMAAKTGTHVGAAAAGEVVHAGPAGTYGNLVTVRHENGFETRYAHLSKVDVKKGDKVDAGQHVGEVGSTGHSTGPHLHFEIRKEGKAMDPRPYLPEGGAKPDEKKILNPSSKWATR